MGTAASLESPLVEHLLGAILSMGKLSRKGNTGEKWGGNQAVRLALFSLAGPAAPKPPLSDGTQPGEKQAAWHGVLAPLGESLGD